MKKLINVALIATSILFLVSCGGGGGGSSGGGGGSSSSQVPVVDTDKDGVADVNDTDDDNDGVLDAQDAFPLDKNESVDTDGDKIGNNADLDDDGDGVPDDKDFFPLDKTEAADFDGDGIGDNADPDDDNDGKPDATDTLKGIITDLPSAIPAATNFQADASRDYVYITHRLDKSLSVVNVKTGKLVKTLKFDYMPERMFLSADATKLYVTLVTKDHYYYSNDAQSGYVVTIDLSSLTQTASLALTIDPYDLVVTTKGKLIVSGGSGSWTTINAYSLETGANLGAVNISPLNNLTLSASEDAVYAIENQSGPFQKFDISGAGITNTSYTGWIGNVRYEGDLWATPDSKYVITKGGSVVSVSGTFVSQLTQNNIQINALTFDVPTQTMLLSLSNNTTQLLNLTNFEVINQYTLFGAVNISALMGDNLYSLVSNNGVLSIIKQEHPCPKCATNAAPKAAFGFTPANGNTTSAYVFDASASTDVDGDKLSYRWDVNADGLWDSAFSNVPTYETRFIIPGTKYVRLQVKDAGGLTATSTQAIDVTQGVDSGTPVLNSVPNLLTFTITDSVTNKANTKLYFTDKSAKRLYVVDLLTGVTERYFSFDGYPDDLALSPDGSRLFVIFRTKETNSYGYDDQALSYVGVIDTQQNTYVNTFATNENTYTIVAKSNDKVITLGTSNGLRMFDVTTGSVIGDSYYTYYDYGLAINSTGTTLYVSDSSYVNRFDVSSNRLTPLSTSVPGSSYVDYKSWITPDDQYLITRQGGVIRTSDMAGVATIDNIHINQVAFDNPRHLAFLALSNNVIYVVNLTSFEVIKKIATLGQVQALSIADDHLYMTSTLAGITNIVAIDHPCLACGTNQAPVAAFTIAPVSGDTNQSFVFDASTSSDAEAGTLSYQWDLNGDNLWDSGYSSTPTASRRYSVPGTKTVRVQVKDSMGATTILSKTFTVTQGIDVGTPVENSVANKFNFAPTDIATDATRSKLYLTDKQGKRLYVVDLVSGLTEKYYEFEFMPERMALSPDGATLYVSLLASNHEYGSKPGYVAVVDLASQAVTKTYTLDNAPYDLAVSKAGNLVVTADSGSSNGGGVYNALTGNYLFTTNPIYRDSIVVPHPTNEWIYTINSGLRKYSLTGNSLVEVAQYTGERYLRYGDDFWITPDGNYLVTQGGDVLSASDLSFVTGLTEQGVSISGVGFDKAAKLIFVSGSDEYLYTINTVSWETISKTKLVDPGLSTSVVGAKIYTVVAGYNGATLVSQDHPCLPCATNQAPTARFTFSPGNGDTGSVYLLDASTSSDPDDDNLTYRWDLNGDGVWDTSFSSQATLSKRFSLAGNKTVSLQVKDAYGLVHTLSKSFTVAQGIDTGTTVNGSTAFTLDFTASYTITDKANSKLYVSDRGAKRLYIVDLLTGLTEKYFEFEFMPERMSIDPEGKFLYLALPAQDHNYYWWEDAQYGYVAVINLASQNVVKVFSITTDPYGIAAVANHKVIVSSGSGQWTYIQAYDGETGSYVWQSSIRQQSNLNADAAGKWVFAADTDSSPSDIEKFDVQGIGITALGDSPYHGDHRMDGNVWVTPNGQYLITAGGDVYLSSDMSYVKSMTPQGVQIESLAFNTSNQTVVTLGSDNKVTSYSLDGFTQSGSPSAAFAAPKEVIVIGTKVYVLKVENAKYMLQSM